jgi:hypothetical protein
MSKASPKFHALAHDQECVEMIVVDQAEKADAN